VKSRAKRLRADALQEVADADTKAKAALKAAEKALIKLVEDSAGPLRAVQERRLEAESCHALDAAKALLAKAGLSNAQPLLDGA